MNVLALCAGVGGLDIGLRLAEPTARTVCYVEGEAYAAAVLVARMADKTLDEAPIWSDLRSFDARPWRGVVDCVTGGYPCQPFSVAGKRRGAEDPRHLWPHVARIVRECEPARCFFENVAGHLSLGFEEVVSDLEGMGYRVAAGLFTAEEVGAPHKRERLFVLADAPYGEDRKPGVAECEELSIDGLYPVGNPGRARLEGRRGEPLPESADELPPWPPSPAEWDLWGRVLRVRPDIAPAWFEEAEGETQPGIRGLVDGVPYRVDRLRACGNGVVPLVAAHAYLTLRDALLVGREERCLTLF